MFHPYLYRLSLVRTHNRNNNRMIYTSTPTHICVRIYMYGLWRIYYVYKWMRCVHRLETHKIYSSLKVLSGLVFLKLKQWWIFRPCVVCVAMWDSPTSFSDAPSAEAASNTRMHPHPQHHPKSLYTCTLICVCLCISWVCVGNFYIYIFFWKFTCILTMMIKIIFT